jgi:hypothetical protein
LARGQTNRAWAVIVAGTLLTTITIESTVRRSRNAGDVTSPPFRCTISATTVAAKDSTGRHWTQSVTPSLSSSLFRAGEVRAPAARQGDRTDDVDQVDAEQPVRGLVEVVGHGAGLPVDRHAVDELVPQAADDAREPGAGRIAGIRRVDEHHGHAPAPEGGDDLAVLGPREVATAPRPA